MILRTLIVLFAFIVPATTRAALTPEEIKNLPDTKIEAALPSEHPSSYYSYAVRLFSEGRKDESIFWFYIGQLRYRVYLKATPPSDPSGDPALFASLNATVGQTINEYAGGDPKVWAAQIALALKWDSDHPNGFTSKEKFKTVYDSIRAGLERLGKYVESSAGKMREERKKRGLENRG
ncbi:MAG TPA: hypothetical protein VGM64_09405 [Lacunisphaera sp.]|jgi:hypothetical protein